MTARSVGKIECDMSVSSSIWSILEKCPFGRHTNQRICVEMNVYSFESMAKRIMSKRVNTKSKDISLNWFNDVIKIACILFLSQMNFMSMHNISIEETVCFCAMLVRCNMGFYNFRLFHIAYISIRLIFDAILSNDLILKVLRSFSFHQTQEIREGLVV